MRRSLTLATALLVAACAMVSPALGQTTQPAQTQQAGPPVEFGPLYEAGDELLLTHTERTEQTGMGGMMVSSTMTELPMALTEGEEGQTLGLAIGMRRIRTEMTRGQQQMVQDSADPNSMDQENAEFITALLAMEGTGVMTPRGQVQQMQVQAELMMAAIREQLAQMPPEVQAEFTEERLLREMATELTRMAELPAKFLPAQPTAPGQSWTVPLEYSIQGLPGDPNDPPTAEIQCTLANVEVSDGRHVATINLQGRDQQQTSVNVSPQMPPMAVNIQAEFTGAVLVDLDASELVELRIDRNTTITAQGMPPQSGRHIQTITLTDDPGPAAPAAPATESTEPTSAPAGS